MDREGFRNFLREREILGESIDTEVEAVAQFEAFLSQFGSPAAPTARPGAAPALPGTDLLRRAGPAEVDAYVAKLIGEKANTRGRIVALARYGWYIENDPLYVAAFELLDGSEALDNLYRRLGGELGAERRGEVFADHPPPPLGMPNRAKPHFTQTVIRRLLDVAGPERCAQILGEGLRTLPDDAHYAARQKYQEIGSLDAYLQQRAEDFIGELERARESKRLWFTQEITGDVIAFVREHPEIASAIRHGNVLYTTKIPYLTKQYLAATDERTQRYYYCHCPWVRESLRTGDAQVPPVWCNCSAAFVKKPYEVIFGQPLKAEMVETVLQGDRWCRFAIHLPERGA